MSLSVPNARRIRHQTRDGHRLLWRYALYEAALVVAASLVAAELRILGDERRLHRGAPRRVVAAFVAHGLHAARRSSTAAAGMVVKGAPHTDRGAYKLGD